MALLFRTELGGGSSIEPYIVNVTCAPSMVGKTVTMTQGSTVLSKICPSSLEVTFKPMNDGLWTIECEGSTKDVTLLAWGTYNVSISWGLSGWLETIGKTTTETSLLAYLNDVNNQADIRELMTRHVSADYLYDWYANIPSVLDDVMNSTYGAKWLGLRDYVCDKFMANETAKATMLNSNNWEYILKDKVPVMTSNTAPYGEVIGGEYSGDAWVPWHVFDGDSNTGWATPAYKTTNMPIGYKFNNPICIKALYIENITISGITNRGVKDFKIQYSDDNDTWNDAYSDTLGSGESKLFVFSNAGYHIYWRLLCVNNHGAEYICIYTLQFYGRSLKVSIPKMTSNTEPWGIVTATDYYKDVSTSYDPWRAFANGTERGWLPANFNDELVYDFGYPVLVKKMTLRNAKQASTETSKVYYDLFGSIDGQKYDLIQNDVNCYTHRNDLFTYSINTNKYRFYKLVCTKNDNGRATSGYGCILQLYGLDYSEREFEEGSTIKYLYDHGVELEEISLGSDATKQVDSILLSCTGDNNNACAYVQKTLTENLFRATIRNAKILKSSYLIIASNPLNVVTSDAYSNLVQENAPNNFGLDVSNFKNSNKYIGVRTQGTSGEMLEILELWLE